MKGILPIIKNKSGCDFHRIVMPLKYLGLDIDTIPHKTTPQMLKDNHILFFNRVPENDPTKVLEYIEKYDLKIVLDLDDYWELNVTHPSYKTWTENKIGEQIIMWLKHASAVIVTTALLADKVLPLNKNVHIIPNALPFDQGQFTSDRNDGPPDKRRFIFAGGSSHVRDIKLLTVPLQKLNPLPHAHFMLAGYNPSPEWESMERSFTLGGKLKNYERVNNQPLDYYMDVYNFADVSLVPLESNIFTPYKSNLKILEAGCKNMPVICSDVPPYSLELDREMVMYAKNVKDWVRCIKWCSENPGWVEDQGVALGTYVRKHYDLIKINEYRRQLFENLMA